MRVSTKSDYALRALIELAAEPGDRAITADELGRRQDIPHGFLQSILGDLRKAGILLAQRGQSGGWRMAREAATVTIADVIREGRSVTYDMKPSRNDPTAVGTSEVADAIIDKLGVTAVA